MPREAVERTGDAFGDGTSTLTILAHAILVDGVRNVAAGASGVDLKCGVGRGGRRASLHAPAGRDPHRQGPGGDHLRAQRPDIGNLVADAFESGLRRASCRSRKRRGRRRRWREVVEGGQFDRGYLSPNFVTDPDKMRRC